jgi:hypothetical protein
MTSIPSLDAAFPTTVNSGPTSLYEIDKASVLKIVDDILE